MKKNKTNQESRDLWRFIEQTSERVSEWPSWTRGDSHRDVHVVPSQDGGGWIILSGGEQVSQHRTKADAIAHGRGLAQTYHSEQVIHSLDGRIVERNSCDQAPTPPRSRKR